VRRLTGNKIKIHSISENRAADIPIYISDNTLINNTCGWKPVIKPKDILIDIFDWIKDNELVIRKLLS
jgi:CDP-paratose 2-epimerase